MDIQFLLLLQQLRNAAGSIPASFMLFISTISVISAGAIATLVYWCLDRSQGYWIITNCLGGLMVNNTVKLTACVYRPWIREPALVPPARALSSATGYSFPSGHTQFAVSFYGSVYVSRDRKEKVLRTLCVIMVLLTGFSRLYLSVHTPQDVLISILIGTALLKVNSIIFGKIRKDGSLLIRFVAAGCLFIVLCVLFFRFKTYPMDYIDGQLIVDPEDMMQDGFTAAGAALTAGLIRQKKKQEVSPPASVF